MSWSPQQRCFRNLLVALRGAYYHDRAALFWARHRVRVEFYKYSTISGDDSASIESLTSIGNEIASFIKNHMDFSVQRVVDHNETLKRLPVEDAKKFRERYLEREAEHESWCKTRIKLIMRRREPPPYPFA